MVFDVERVLAGLTLEEKASLTSGSDFWHTQGVDRAGVPAVMVTDGPHGLRKQAQDADHLGLGASVPATCFPPAAALGSTWDPDLLHRVGEALGRETRANDVAVLLGPGVNIKRTPLCGRNFEYVSEDPFVAGALGTAIVAGIQSQGVGTSLKHFAANNQETDRMRVSADVDERTLREIYLPAFEAIVKNAQPWTVMCSYNKVNGTYASENRWLLTEVLRDEWALRGPRHVRLGRCPRPGPRAGRRARPADARRRVAARRRDRRRGARGHARRGRARRRRPPCAPARRALASRAGGQDTFDVDEHHALAREAAADGSVLLKNDPVDGCPLLPLTGDFLVVGEFARTPRYQGAGSSQVNPTRLDTALDALGDVPFEPGFTIAGGPEGDDDVAARRRQSPRRARRRPSSCSSACPGPTSPRATTARGSACRTTRWRCSRPSRRSTRAWSSCSPTAPRSPCPGVGTRPRSSRRGSAARPAAARWRTCCTAAASRRAGSPRRSRTGSTRHPRVRQLPRRGRPRPLRRGRRWSATAGTTRASSTSPTRSGTACRTRASPTPTSRRASPAPARTRRSTCGSR